MCEWIFISAIFSNENETGFIRTAFTSVMRQMGKGGSDYFLIACAGVVDDSNGGVWIEPVGKKFFGDRFHGFDGHIVDCGKRGFVSSIAGGDFTGSGAGVSATNPRERSRRVSNMPVLVVAACRALMPGMTW